MRFINEKEQQSINQASSPFIHYLLLLIITMEIIPLPDLPFTGFGPIYPVVLLSVLVMAANFKSLPTISPITIKIILLLLFYHLYSYVLAWGLNILDQKPDIESITAGIRKCTELLIFSIACTNFTELKRILFTIGILLCISALFSLLLYYFEESFQGIYVWLLRSKLIDLRGTDAYVNNEHRVIGLCVTAWFFGYLMCAAPAIAIICGRLSYFKGLWRLAFLLLFSVLFLNGQRAGFLGACFAIVSLVICWRLISIPYIFLVITFLLSVYTFQLGSHETDKARQENTGDLNSRLESSDADTEDRLNWWKAGAISVIEHPFTGPTHEEYLDAYYGTTLNHVAVVNPHREIPVAHNSFINPGVNMGIIGWCLMLLYLIIFKGIFVQVFRGATKEKQEKIIFEGVPILTVAPMINSIFQNESIFNGEPMTVCLTGLLISSYQVLYNRNYYQI